MKDWKAAARRAKVLRGEKKSFDDIAVALMNEGFSTINGNPTWNVGSVHKLVNGTYGRASESGRSRAFADV